jgi:Nucleotidyltransferase domain.
MSGGRSSGYFGSTERSTESIRALAEDKTADEALNSEVNELLAGRLALINPKDPAFRNERLEAILDALQLPEEDRLSILMGGSLAKRTYLEGLSDVDALVVLTDPDLIDAGPTVAKQRFLDRLSDRLSRGDIASIAAGRLAVTITYQDGSQVQLLPAIREGNLLRIADHSGDHWAQIRPREFAERLTAANVAQSGRLVPVIKLAKLAVASFPESRQLSGYHVENLAIDVFREYTGPKTYKAMLEHLFAKGADRVLRPMVDVTGQSLHVDEALGAPDSLPRRLASDSLARLGRRLATARSTEDWASLIPEPE